MRLSVKTFNIILQNMNHSSGALTVRSPAIRFTLCFALCCIVFAFIRPLPANAAAQSGTGCLISGSTPDGKTSIRTEISITIRHMSYTVEWFKARTSYTAGYKSKSGSWHTLNQTTGNWQPASAAETNQFEAIASKAESGKIETKDGSKSIIGKAYYSGSKSGTAGINAASSITVTMPDESGCLLVIQDGSGNSIALEREGTFYELKGSLTKEAVWKSMDEWLDSADGKTGSQEDQKRNKALAALLRDSLLNAHESQLGGLYGQTSEGSWYLRKYLEKTGMNRSVYGELLYGKSGKTYNPARFEQLTAAERESFAKAAETYLTNGAEYETEKTREQNKVYSAIVGYETKIKELEKNGKKGNPLPYMDEGSDTAKIFWYKMAQQARARNSDTTLPEKKRGWIPWVPDYIRNEYDPSGYIPGRDTGCNELGLINGAVVTAGLDGKVKWSDTDKDNSTNQLKGYEDNLPGNTSKEKEKTLATLYSNRKLEEENFEKISAYVPDASLARRGDILMYKDSGTNTVKAAVITGLPAGTPAYGSDQSAYIQAMEIVYMDEQKGKAIRVKVSESFFSKVPERLIIMRLLKQTGKSSGVYKTAVWDVLDCNVVKTEATAGKMREQTQGNEENWRFIPNTGEYLILGELKVSAYTVKGLEIPPGEDVRIRISGAEDRKYDESKKGDGNIYVNKAGSFEIAVLDTNGVKLNTGKALVTRSEGAKYETNDLDELNLRIDAGGRIVNAETNGLIEIGVRPESILASYAGDDLLLLFELNNRGIKHEVKMAEKDYIAVYDKKLLWRANLYIDEGADDWNNIHPWDAPPDAGRTENPAWWNADWGYNEWNKPQQGYTGRKGGQVVSIPSTKWYYGMYSSQHKAEGTVAYDIQGWDDPFSFREKLRQQGILLNQWYTLNEVPFEKGVYEWETGATLSKEKMQEYTGTLIISGSMTKEEAKQTYNEYLTDAGKRWANDEVLGKNSGAFWEDKADGYNRYIYPEKYGSNVSPYKVSGKNDFTPVFIEGVRKAADEGVKINGETVYPYVPGLSDSLRSGSEYPHQLISKETAGVDCIGFVQRSHAWKDSKYSALNTNSHRKEPVYWTSKDSDIPESAMPNFYNDAYSAQICDYEGEEVDNTLTTDSLTDTIKVYDEFQYAVPGDIVYYPGQHIMMVSEINEPSGPEKRYVMDDITVIESVYSNYAERYGVIKDRKISKLKTSETAAIKSWEMRRLK